MEQSLTGKPLGIGSMPHVEVDKACALVLEKFPDSPFWPEFPRRDWRESMGMEQARGLPGAVVDTARERIYFDLERDLSEELARFYEAYINEDLDSFAVSFEYLPGFETMGQLVSKSGMRPALLKGQLTGPTTLGLVMKDAGGKALLYDEQMMDVLVKATRLKAQWMIDSMAPHCDRPAMFFDEPMLQSVGSASIPIDKETAIMRLKEIVSGLECLTGGHCCGNTDWSIMMSAGLDVIAYDAWSFGDTLGLYGEALANFVRGGGYVAWGIVPATAEGATLNAKDVAGRLDNLINETAAKCGLSTQELKEHGFATPSCGLGSLSEIEAEVIMDLTAEVAGAVW